jgi:hypothetical protein
MRYDTKNLSTNLRRALEHGVLQRVPLTFLPFVNQQLAQWEFLFPNERNSVEALLLHLDRLSAEDSTVLFRKVTQIEDEMGVRSWRFAVNEQTIQNSSELARSPYFQQWRQAVQDVFDEVNKQKLASAQEVRSKHRLLLIDIPAALPMRRETAWRRWHGTGKVMNFDADSQTGMREWIGALLNGRENRPGLFEAMQRGETASSASAWVIDAGSELVDSVLQAESAEASRDQVLLSYQRLDGFRDRFSRAMNSMRKDLSDADAVFDHLRGIDVQPWCSQEVAADPAVREFVRSLYLSGNGAVIFGNSFVEWGASEAFRRARPTVLVARFGVRAKPKPFTGVAVFDNPDQINPAPSVDDLPGSAKDAEILAWYVWLSAARYPEYQSATVCVCLAESIGQAYLIAPIDFEIDAEKGPVSLNRLQGAMNKWVA